MSASGERCTVRVYDDAYNHWGCTLENGHTAPHRFTETQLGAKKSVVIPVVHRAQAVAGDLLACSRYGVELDVRDHLGTTIVSHDPWPWVSPKPLSLRRWLEADLEANGQRPLYALNIKADGLCSSLVATLGDLGVLANSFAFDMSYPQYRVLRNHMRCAGRLSEEEPSHCREADVWLDRWNWNEDIPMGHSIPFDNGRPAIVMPVTTTKGTQTQFHAASPELHIPNSQMSWLIFQWRKLASFPEVVSICTDYPRELEEALA